MVSQLFCTSQTVYNSKGLQLGGNCTFSIEEEGHDLTFEILFTTTGETEGVKE